MLTTFLLRNQNTLDFVISFVYWTRHWFWHLNNVDNTILIINTIHLRTLPMRIKHDIMSFGFLFFCRMYSCKFESNNFEIYLQRWGNHWLINNKTLHQNCCHIIFFIIKFFFFLQNSIVCSLYNFKGKWKCVVAIPM